MLPFGVGDYQWPRTGDSPAGAIRAALGFADGEAEFDEIVFATGYGEYQDTAAHALGDDAAAQLTIVYGTDAESDIRGIPRDTCIPNVMFNVGNLPSSSASSRFIALQMLLQREAKLGERYTMAKRAAEGTSEGCEGGICREMIVCEDNGPPKMPRRESRERQNVPAPPVCMTA